MSGARIGISCAVLYGAVAIFTYGRSAAEEAHWLAVNCATMKQRIEVAGTTCYGSPAFDALGAAFVWPLYWSWELQQ